MTLTEEQLRTRAPNLDWQGILSLILDPDTDMASRAFEIQRMALALQELRDLLVDVGTAQQKPSLAAISNKTYQPNANVDETLPQATGGNAPLTYRISHLPSWLDFDQDTRDMTGTAPASADPVLVEYRVTDEDGDFDFRLFTIDVA